MKFFIMSTKRGKKGTSHSKQMKKKMLSCEELRKNKVNRGRFRNKRQRNFVSPRGTNRASVDIFSCFNFLYSCEV